jgi:hypothetical protein
MKVTLVALRASASLAEYTTPSASVKVTVAVVCVVMPQALGFVKVNMTWSPP